MAPSSTRPEGSEWVRYPAAVIVAFTTSVATTVLYAILAESAGLTSDSSPALSDFLPVCALFLAGFNGVFFGSFCFRRAKRGFGAVVLLVLGIGFYFIFIGSISVARGESLPFPAIFITAIGGGVAVAWRYRHQPSNPAPEPIAAVHSVSDEPSNSNPGNESASASSGSEH